MTGKAQGTVRLLAGKRTGVFTRLLRYDALIAVNATRATFSTWHDRLIAATMLLFALAAVRSWLLDRPWSIAAAAAGGAGVLIGLTAGRQIAARLAFHAFDGPLAADALHPAARRHYLIGWHVTGLALLAIMTVVARPSLLIAGLASYPVGALIGHGMGGVAMAGPGAGRAGFGRVLRSWIQRPPVGIAAGAILLLSLSLTARWLDADALVVVAGIEAALSLLALTVVDDRSVRFLTIAGQDGWRIVGRQARGAMLFAGVAVPVCAFASGPVVAGVVAAISIVALLLMAMRILAYRIHDKRFADLVVSMLTAVLTLTAVTMPITLPIVVTVILWKLQRRAAPRTWLLA